jgi:hypothetical protein
MFYVLTGKVTTLRTKIFVLLSRRRSLSIVIVRSLSIVIVNGSINLWHLEKPAYSTQSILLHDLAGHPSLPERKEGITGHIGIRWDHG